MKTNSKVDDFMEDLQFLDEEKREIVISLRESVLEIAPEAKEEIKYGGLVFLPAVAFFLEFSQEKTIYPLNLTEGQRLRIPIIFWKEGENTGDT